MSSESSSEIADLERRAAALSALLPNARRAFVIEFSGTPKSGKSTSVEAIRHFFSRNGFRVHVLAERAAVCPIPMKGHLFFNTWCATSMLAELLENVEAESDLIIVDRGIFDTLVWLGLQERRGQLMPHEAQAIASFLLLDRWRTLIDLSIVMRVSAAEALARENNQRITSKPGSIMNPEVLSAITESVTETVKRYRSKFPAVIDLDTTVGEVKSTNTQLAHQILDNLSTFLNPRILVVPRLEIAGLPMREGGAFTPEAVQLAIDVITKHGRFLARAEAEGHPDLVQIVACGLLTEGEKVFLFQRKENDPKSRLYGRNTIWQGSHVAEGVGSFGPELLKEALQERITRSLFLSRMFQMEIKGYCWDRDDARSSHHFGVIFQIVIDNPDTASDLRQKEFRHGRGHGLAGRFVSWTELKAREDELNLESWSQAILNSLDDLRGLRTVV